MTARQVKEELENALNLKALGLTSDPLANLIIKLGGDLPFGLVYQQDDNQIEIINKIYKERLSSLIGFELHSKTKAYIILFRTITAEDLKGNDNPTLADIRAIADEIHPGAKPINSDIAAQLWSYAQYYYISKFLLGKKGIELPDIQKIAVVNEIDADSQSYVEKHESFGLWVYEENGGEIDYILYNLPLLCYYEKE